MMKTLTLAASLLALASLANAQPAPSNAQAAPAHGTDCFLASHYLSYSYIDPHHISIHYGPSRDYLLATEWDARDLRWVEALAIRSRGSDWICTGNGLGVEIIGGHMRQTYPVSSITRMPPPAAQKPAHGA